MIRVKKLIFIFLIAIMFHQSTYAGFNFLNRLVMGKNGMTVDEDVFHTPNLQPEWIKSPKPQFSREDFEYLRHVLGHDYYFAEIEFLVDEQGNVLDAQLLSTNGIHFKDEEILKAAQTAKMKYDFKQNTQFPFRFKSSFYFYD